MVFNFTQCGSLPSRWRHCCCLSVWRRTSRARASRCCGCAFPLSVQECVEGITSPILPVARNELRPEELRLFFAVRSWRALYVLPCHIPSLGVATGQRGGIKLWSAPASVWEVCNRIWESTTLSESRWRNKKVTHSSGCNFKLRGGYTVSAANGNVVSCRFRRWSLTYPP